VFSFRPSREAELVIADNAMGSPQKIPIRWSRPTPGPSPQIDATPNPLDFGEVPVGLTHEAPARQVLTLTNSGQAPVMALHVEISGDQKTFRIVENGCNGPLGVGSSCSIAVMFAPQQAKRYNETLWVVGDNLRSLTILRILGTGRPQRVIE
jgi:Abnormal spindle-like microcephaly-assoc'd, ASPM-SPD-2-Hydin